MSQRVRVLLAISSPLTLKAVESLVAEEPDIEVVGISRRMSEVVGLLNASMPHLLCVDDAPPSMDALEVTRTVMGIQACPILVLSGSSDAKRRRLLLEAGAVDEMVRPSTVATLRQTDAQQFTARLKMLSHVPVIGRRAPAQLATLHPRDGNRSASSTTPSSSQLNGIIAIGASTGGPIALMTVLSELPAHFPYPIVCVQHVSQGFLEGMVAWLNEGCRLNVAVAQAGEIARAGTVLFPPEGKHLEVGIGGRIRLSDGAQQDGHRPSITTLFESVAASYGTRATAILLTGMGSDGARGMVAVYNAGGETIAQDEASCVVFGMPRAAIELGAARHICSPTEIARYLQSQKYRER